MLKSVAHRTAGPISLKRPENENIAHPCSNETKIYICTITTQKGFYPSFMNLLQYVAPAYLNLFGAIQMSQQGIYCLVTMVHVVFD